MDPVTGWLACSRAHVLVFALAPSQRPVSQDSIEAHRGRLLAGLPSRRSHRAPTTDRAGGGPFRRFKDDTLDLLVACRALPCTANPWVLPEGGVPFA